MKNKTSVLTEDLARHELELDHLNGTEGVAALCLYMEYKGIRFEVVQTANPTGWKWVVHFDPNRRKSGISFSRAMAITSAKYAIEKGLKALARVK